MIKQSWILVLLLSLCSFAHAETILVIESYHAEYGWNQSYRRGLEEVLNSKHKLVYFEMDTKRLPKSRFPERADAAWQRYKQLSPDLVILADDNALKYLSNRFVNTDTPVVYLGINGNPRDYKVANAVNFSGVLERPLLIRSILMLKKYLTVNQVLVLLDSGHTSELLKDDIFYGENTAQIGGIRIDVKLVDRFEQWQEQVLSARKNNYDALVAGLYHTLKDPDGNSADPETIIKWTSNNSQIPPFGLWDFSIGAEKNIGGYVVFGYEQGLIAGEIAAELIDENKMNVRTRIGNKGRFIFSKTQLEKWKIQLPKDIKEQTTFVD
ncbi:hypothetical protein L3Q72_15680 [Vibrio sp. JC009]|uniref:ABC transporter substrate-binding protein n=1 Tax=Vibrio sp. JC009 TaxID=2912314 RepID=UPI0023B0CD14|nr:hypothetical protein [Vibrio sp. JC009]WED24318.1 hypothetical protein L3Q72_15680 [Vibrio sp. JC009]